MSSSSQHWVYVIIISTLAVCHHHLNIASMSSSSQHWVYVIIISTLGLCHHHLNIWSMSSSSQHWVYDIIIVSTLGLYHHHLNIGSMSGFLILCCFSGSESIVPGDMLYVGYVHSNKSTTGDIHMFWRMYGCHKGGVTWPPSLE